MSWNAQCIIWIFNRRLDTIQQDISQIKETVAEKRPRTERSESDMHTEGVGEASQTSTQCQSRHKKGCMPNIYLTDSV